jgi:hypothetical protein
VIQVTKKAFEELRQTKEKGNLDQQEDAIKAKKCIRVGKGPNSVMSEVMQVSKRRVKTGL